MTAPALTQMAREVAEIQQAARRFLARSPPAVAATKPFVLSVLAGLPLLAEWQDDAAPRSAVAALPAAFSRALALDGSPMAERLVPAQSLFVLGCGSGFAIASAAALTFEKTP